MDERTRIERGLAADRENARYAEPDAERPSGAAVGAPSAAPRTPVSPAPMMPSGPAPSDRLPAPAEPPPPPSDMPSDQHSALEESGPQTAALDDSAQEQGSAEPAAYASKPAMERPSPVQPAVAHSPAMPEPIPAQAAAASRAVMPAAAPARPALPVTQVAQATQAVQSDAFPAPAPANDASAGESAALPDEQPIGNWPTRSVEKLPRAFLIYFPSGSAKLDVADRGTLREVIRIYKNRGGPMQIVGHASSRSRHPDSLQSELANFRLSGQRADAVARELERMGVARADMVVSAVSDSEPLYGESTPTGEAGNRRVEVFFTP
jgi:flagellar motor protein MotB